MLSPYRKKYFMLDPNFPERLLKAGDRRTINFIQFLSAEYSRRGLTEKTDRRSAIYGLESRIAQAKKCETRFGIFESFLHRCLLWQRSGKEDMDRIDYKTQIVPSWSWMAYNGSFHFTDIAFDQVEWVRSLGFNKPNEHSGFNEKLESTLITDISSFRRCNVERKDTGYTVLNLDGAERGEIQYDTETHEHLDAEGCVVVGRDSRKSDAGERKYYILVVRPTGIEKEYTRVGVGWILSEYIAKQGIQALIV
jgi:hypothetical protein